MPFFNRAGIFIRDQNHWIGIGGLILGIILSFYFYFASKQTGEVSLYFKTVKIVQSGVPLLKILDDRNQLISTDVFGLEVTAWNNGEFSLGDKSDRVRRPLTITLEPNVYILGAQLQATGKSATQSELGVQPQVTQEGVQVTWKEFDPGDAFKLLILYTAKKQSVIAPEARIVGTKFHIISDQKEIDPQISEISFSISGVQRMYSKYLFNLQYRLLPTLLQTVAWIVFVPILIIFLISILVPGRSRTFRPAMMVLLIIGQFAMVLGSLWPSSTPPI